MHENFMARIGARIKEFQAKMKQVDAQVRKTAMGTDKPIGADISEFLRKAALVAAQARALARDKVIIPVEVRVNNFQQRMDRIANTIRSLSTVIQNQLGGAFLSISPTLAPIIATLTGALGNLGPMIGTLGGSTFALGSAFGFAGTAAIGFGAAAIPTIKAIFGETENLTVAQAAARADFDKTESVWQRIVKTVEQPVMDGFTKAMEISRKVLSSVEPMFLNTANAVNGLLDSLNKEVGGAELQNFFRTLNDYAGPFTKVLGEALGLLGKGFMNMMVAFAPLSLQTAEGFRAMAERFAEWANGLSASDKFQSFVDYVNTNMPKMRAIFRDAIAGIVYLFAGFGDSSAGMMDGLVNMMSRFKQWASELGNNQNFQMFLGYIADNAPKVISLIGNITTFLVNLGIGLAPVGSLLLDLVNRFLSWTNSLMENNRVVGVIISVITVLAGLFLALVPTIVAITTLFSGFGTALMAGVGKAFTFVKPLFTNFGATIAKVAPFISSLASKALPLLSRAFMFLGGPVGIIIGVLSLLIPVFIRLWNENEKFREGVITVWNAIKTTISTVVQAVSDFVMSVWGAIVVWWNENNESIKTTAKSIWDAVYNTIVTVLTTAWGFIMQVVTLIQEYWAEHGDSILSNAKTAWEGIKTAITTFLSATWEFIKEVVTRIQEFWNEHGETILSIAKAVWEDIKTAISLAIDVVWSVIKLALELIQGIFETVWPIISGVVEIAWAAITTAVEIATDLVFGIIDTIMNLIKGDWEAAWESIKETANSIWDSIVSIFEGIDLVQIGKDIIQGLIDGIASMATAVWDTVTGVAGNILDAITKKTDTHSPSRETHKLGEFIGQGLVNGLASMGRKVRDTAIGIAGIMTDNLAPKIALADMGVSASLDTSINNSDMRGVKHAFSAELDKFELPDRDIILVMDGREVGRVTAPYVKDENDMRKDMIRIGRG
ncbi:phage tail protein [Jeotgalibacillus soli]|uniref:Uncharacterized protein n=1 Tax=Jeotgalibacillus soli TaxID=889306 RepID=A0A0C2VMU7_9BACL|nr:hypothetical protein [Jeotgalibacillus soli]KIL45766.1 hypothetical protein KP78_21150 [Jeotgalibacillus soli]